MWVRPCMCVSSRFFLPAPSHYMTCWVVCTRVCGCIRRKLYALDTIHPCLCTRVHGVCVHCADQLLNWDGRPLGVTIAALPRFINERRTSLPAFVLAFSLISVCIICVLIGGCPLPNVASCMCVVRVWSIPTSISVHGTGWGMLSDDAGCVVGACVCKDAICLKLLLVRLPFAHPPALRYWPAPAHVVD